MFFKKKKKIEITNNKYNLYDSVSFRYNNELRVGTITNITLDKDNDIAYAVNVGGECPFIVSVKETKIITKI